MSWILWAIIGGIVLLIWLFFWAICKSTRAREEAWQRAIVRAEYNQKMREEE